MPRSALARPVAHTFATSYLRHHRGIDLRSAELELGQALVGHTGHGWTNLVDHLRSRGVTDTELVAMDLAQTSRKGRLIDTLRDRLIIPVTHADGRITGFVGRDTSSNPRAPKYRNPTRTVTFDKSDCLYRPTHHCVPDAAVVIVEGALDALAITAAASRPRLIQQISRARPSASALHRPRPTGPCTSAVNQWSSPSTAATPAPTAPSDGSTRSAGRPDSSPSSPGSPPGWIPPTGSPDTAPTDWPRSTPRIAGRPMTPTTTRSERQS